MRNFWLVFLTAALGVSTAQAKESYTLFHPTPEAEMREFNPDRPGSTNTPYTIDPGHFQVEMELINYSVFNQDDGSQKQINFPNPNVRVGLTESFEAEVSWLPYLTQRVSTGGGPNESTSGMGDLNVKIKENLIGNNAGQFVLGIMPGIKIPTHSNGLGNSKWEPSLMIPILFNLQDVWEISLMPEIDVKKDNDSEGMHAEFNSPFNFGRALSDTIDVYAEFVLHLSGDTPSTWANYFGFGITLQTSKNVQFDVGMNFGVSRLSPNYNPSAGYVFRY